jgi:hypothetical protein
MDVFILMEQQIQNVIIGMIQLGMFSKVESLIQQIIDEHEVLVEQIMLQQTNIIIPKKKKISTNGHIITELQQWML